jgi:hypothetical protein
MVTKKEIEDSFDFPGPLDDDIEDSGITGQMSKYSTKGNNKSKDLNELLNMTEDSTRRVIIAIEINEYIRNPETKKELIQRLLGEEGRRYKSERKKENGKRDHMRSEDPKDPENVADFRKAYKKLAEKLYDSKNKLVKPEDLKTTNVHLNKRY